MHPIIPASSIAIISGIASITFWAALAQDATVNSDKQAISARSKTTVADVAWIAGHWQGEAMGGTFEETWNPPFGGTMMGMFKFVQNGEVVFYELLTIVEKQGTLMLRLKHFDKSLAGWEEKDKSVEFPLVRLSGTEAIFAGLSFQKIDDSSMHILVAMKDGDDVNEIEFKCNRAGNGPAKSDSSDFGQRYKYRVDLGAIDDDVLKVELTTPTIATDSTTFCIPKIVPGIYGAENYGRFVSNVQAFDSDGRILPVARRDDNRWTISDATKLRRLAYNVDDSWEELEASPSTVKYRSAGASFDANQRFIINHNCLFGYFESLSDLPIQISIRHPDQMVGSTSLPRTSGDSVTDNFTANNYRTLVDNPIVYGNLDSVDFTVANTKITVAVYSEDGAQHAAHFGKVMKPLMVAQARYLGGSLPVDRYTFIIIWEQGPKNSLLGDGLEHSQSTLVLLEGSSLQEATNFIRGICAHEFFHILMPLTIKSDKIADYDFNNPKQSKHLWLYEGMTEYATIHMPMVEGLIDRHDFLKSIRSKIERSTDFRQDVSLTHLSTNAIEMQDQYYNFYLKGALACLCLDIELRDLSDGKMGTQSLLRSLSEKYGKTGSFKDDELFDVIAGITNAKIRDWFASYVEGTVPLPLKSTFAKVGIRFDEDSRELGWIESLTKEQKKLQSQWLANGEQ